MDLWHIWRGRRRKGKKRGRGVFNLYFAHPNISAPQGKKRGRGVFNLYFAHPNISDSVRCIEVNQKNRKNNLLIV